MEKSSQNPPPPSSKPDSTRTQCAALKSLNKSSFKISKPSSSSRLSSSLPPLPSNPDSASLAAASLPPPQPPVYNIDKNNFREIVQKLTGSPAPVPAPPRPAAPIVSTPQQEASNTPRLHRIRPPPLASLSTRPPQMGGNSNTVLSPLPPLPTVGITAESPVSAYLRRLQGGAAGTELVMPPSPLGFGCLPPSPRTATYMMMMANVGMPTSPGVPAPSAREGR